MYINFGAGNPEKDWINLDQSPLFFAPKFVHFLLKTFSISKRSQYFLNNHYKFFKYKNGKKLPFKNNTCDAIYISHVLEHIPTESIQSLLNEFHRILKPSGVVRVIIPDLRKGLQTLLDSSSGWESIDEQLKTLPKQLMNSKIRAAMEGLFGFPSCHKSIINVEQLEHSLGSKWKVFHTLSFLESKIPLEKLKSLEKKYRLEKSIIFELQKN